MLQVATSTTSQMVVASGITTSSPATKEFLRWCFQVESIGIRLGG